MGEKVTIILMKVDLQCDRCYRKIRRVLCKFPEIRDQVYDEKLNVVKITVISCCPEFIMKKIASKGGKSIEKMEMMSLDKMKPVEKPKEGGGGGGGGGGEKKKDEKPKEGGGGGGGGGGGEKKKDEKPKEGGGGGGGGEKKKEGDGEKKKKEGDGGEKKKEGGGGGGGGGGGEKGKDKGAPEKKEGGGGGGGGGGDKGKDKGPPEKNDGGGEHKLVREAPVPVSGYPSIFPPVYPIQASYPPPYYPQPVYGYGPGHNPGPYQHYHGMPGYDHYHRVGGMQYADQYGPYYEENESTCTIM